jgi:hypothetical protein
MAYLLAPNERLTGSAERRRYLQDRLAAIRTAPTLHEAHPQLSCTQMSDLITGQAELPGMELLHRGLRISERRYGQLGLTNLLPPHRVWIGTASREVGAFGGFHYPGQGYQHWQMATIITCYGNLTGDRLFGSQLAVLDLIRAYAHDCLRQGSPLHHQADSRRGRDIGAPAWFKPVRVP